MKYEYDLQYAHFSPDTGVHTEVCIDTVANYGWFERYRMGKEYDYHLNEGGLWFEEQYVVGTVALIDYDGVYELPKTVAWILQQAGVYLDPYFTDY